MLRPIFLSPWAFGPFDPIIELGSDLHSSHDVTDLMLKASYYSVEMVLILRI
jgi:hypothetical protein